MDYTHGVFECACGVERSAYTACPVCGDPAPPPWFVLLYVALRDRVVSLYDSWLRRER